jgi:hypothetical protein
MKMIRGYYSHFDYRAKGIMPEWLVELDGDNGPASECSKSGKPVEPDRTKPLYHRR